MRALALLLVVFLLPACGSKPPAPVVDRSQDRAAWALDSEGNYRVRRGDTLYAIAFRFGVDHRDVARWNGISPPYTIYPDQALRLTPPPAAAATARTTPATSSQRPVETGKTPDSEPVVERPRPPPSSTRARQASPGGDPGSWLWPVKGRVLRGFSPGDPSRNGLDIAGREGQAVVATAGGTVVYSGNGLIGYGELIIVKHSDRMLSAYAHNRVRLVAEGAAVEAGQKIAELGRNDRNEQVLHFEIRRDGRPVNPLNFLPRQ